MQNKKVRKHWLNMYSVLSNDSKILELNETDICSKDKNESKSIKYSIVITFIFLINYFLSSYVILLNYKNNLIKTDPFWNNLQLREAETKCKQSSSYNQTNLDELKLFMDSLNKNKDLNYFLCFSSLYYTAKVEKYDVFRASLDQSSFDVRNSFYNFKNKDKCVLEETLFHYDDENDSKSYTSFNLHLCFLNNDLTEDLCDSLSNSIASGMECDYSYVSGEYTVRINEDVKLSFHEYELGFKSALFYYDYFFSNSGNSSFNYDQYIDDKASLNMGLVGKLFGNEYFNIPKYFFYNRDSIDRREFHFLNYLNAAFRLPSEVVNYFMLFYPKIWFIF